MPIYEFACKDCGSVFDELVISANDSLDYLMCPECESKKVEKLMSAFASCNIGSGDGGSCRPLPSGGFG
jgi:putative FmdB family regulatory protein